MFGYFKTGGQVIRAVKYVDELVLGKSSIQQEEPFLQQIGVILTV